jgi:hypothetical protein
MMLNIPMDMDMDMDMDIKSTRKFRDNVCIEKMPMLNYKYQSQGSRALGGKLASI